MLLFVAMVSVHGNHLELLFDYSAHATESHDELQNKLKHQLWSNGGSCEIIEDTHGYVGGINDGV